MSDKTKENLLEQYRQLWFELGRKPTKIMADQQGIKDYLIRKYFGNWTSFQALAQADGRLIFDDAKDLSNKYRSMARAERRKSVLTEDLLENYFKQLADSIKQMAVKPVQMSKKEVQKQLKYIAKPTQIERELVAVWSDTHFGLNVDPEEVGHKNSYSWQEACRRSAHFAQEIASYKLGHRQHTRKLHLVYLGDLVNGLLHNKSGLDSDLLVFQECGLFHIVYHTISYLLNYFENIEVYAIPGNHDRRLHRENGSRVTSQKYDSHINSVFYALSAAFKGRIKFHLPKTQYVMIDTIGGRLLGAHADTNFSAIGQPGSAINTKKLSYQIETFNAGEVKAGNPPIKGIILGHVHNELQLKTQNGIEVLVNSTMSGLDPYAASLTINQSLPSQTIIESCKSYAIGDIRRVRFNEGIDLNKELDKIVPVYSRELVFK